MTCPICHAPRAERNGSRGRKPITCGSDACRRAYRAAYQREYAAMAPAAVEARERRKAKLLARAEALKARAETLRLEAEGVES